MTARTAGIAHWVQPATASAPPARLVFRRTGPEVITLSASGPMDYELVDVAATEVFTLVDAGSAPAARRLRLLHTAPGLVLAF